jgi:hypothetical protein
VTTSQDVTVYFSHVALFADFPDVKISAMSPIFPMFDIPFKKFEIQWAPSSSHFLPTS